MEAPERGCGGKHLVTEQKVWRFTSLQAHDQRAPAGGASRSVVPGGRGPAGMAPPPVGYRRPVPDVVLIVLGAVLVAAVAVDALATTLSVSSGAGPLTTRLLAWCWRLALAAHRTGKEGSFLTAVGAVLLTTTVLAWVAVLWAGWALVFAGSGAVVDSQSGAPVGPGDVVYYAGMTVFTLGTGDVVSAEGSWRVVMAAASFSGLFLVTLAITYLISVVAAVVTRRALAVSIHALGESSTAIVERGWTGEGFSQMFEQQLIDLRSEVAASAEQHLAYPVLRYFHSPQPHLAAPLAVARLDEALLVLTEGVQESVRPDGSATEPLRYAVARFVATARQGSGSRAGGPPPPVSLAPLGRAGVPMVAEADFDAANRRHADRRTDLHRLVADAGWSWPSS